MAEAAVVEDKAAAAAGGGGGADKGAAAPAAAGGAGAADKGAPAAADKGAPAAAAAQDKGAAAAAAAGEAKGYWPDDWLTRVSKGDEKIAKQLGRYASPEALAEAHIALRRRMDSGEVKTALPKNPKPEELTAWRKDNGIPETPDKYDLKFDSGLVIGKEDKPVIDRFLATAHSLNYTPEMVKGAVEWYMADRDQQVQELAAKDESDRTTALDSLNVEYGGQFRRNINLVEGVLARFPESVREDVKAARLPDGTALFNSPDVVRAFVALALENNPAGVVAPAGMGDAPKAALDEYRGLQKLMRENRAAYNKDAGKQTRMRELIDYLHKQGTIDSNGNEVTKKAA